MNCDICGKAVPLVNALIEGVEMTVCLDCGKFGKILAVPKPVYVKSSRSKEQEIIESVVNDYASRIKQAREKRKLNQEEFAKFLNERLSLLHNIESGRQKPTLDLARKLEKLLNIQLVEKIELQQEESIQKAPKGSLTIGDIISKK